MKNNLSRLIIANYLYILILEIVYKLYIYESLDMNILYLAAFTFPVAVILTIITNPVKWKIVNRILTYIMWVGMFAIYAAEVIYYSFYKTVFSYQALVYGGQVADFYESIFSHILSLWYIMLSMLLPMILLFVLSMFFSFERGKVKHRLVYLLMAITIAVSSISYKSYEDKSLYKLLTNRNDVMETTNYVGLGTTISLDVYKNLTGFEEKIEIGLDAIEPVTEIVEDKINEYNVTDIDFDTLINNEKDETVNQLHKYFKNQNPTNKNEMTGVFKDKNLIFITAEAFYPIAVDKDLTPTLYKLVNDGIKFNNFYQPIYGCSTSDGEFTNLLGLLPGISTCSMDRTHDVYLPYVIGNSFKKYDYDVYAFHGWQYTYYHRDVSYPNLGFEKYYGFDRFNVGYKYALPGIKNQWPTSDVEVMNSAYPIFSQADKYVTYIMSISGHMNYSWGGNAMSHKNKSLVKDLNANESIKGYIAANIEFDRSLEILLNDLEESGTLDDTVIVISADHYPYGLTNDDIKSYVNWVENESFDIYRNNLIIYNTQLTGVTVDKNMGSIDILPTLLNMFDIEYDSRLLVGHDIFSDASDLVIFNNKSWISDKGRYDYIKKKFYPFNGVEVDDDYVHKMNNIVNTKFQVSKTILQKDYYRKVLGE